MLIFGFFSGNCSSTSRNSSSKNKCWLCSTTNRNIKISRTTIRKIRMINVAWLRATISTNPLLSKNSRIIPFKDMIQNGDKGIMMMNMQGMRITQGMITTTINDGKTRALKNIHSQPQAQSNSKLMAGTSQPKRRLWNSLQPCTAISFTWTLRKFPQTSLITQTAELKRRWLNVFWSKYAWRAHWLQTSTWIWDGQLSNKDCAVNSAGNTKSSIGCNKIEANSQIPLHYPTKAAVVVL